MKFNHKTLIIFAGCASAALLGLVSQFLEKSIIDFSAQNMFGFGFADLVYIIFPIIFFFLGFILSSILIKLNSLQSSILVSLLFGLIVSLGYIKNALAMYFRFENFHETYFKSDIFQVCSNLIIFPLIGFLIWNLKKRFNNSYLS